MGIGSAEKNNGFLLVLAIEEDDYYALQGVGLSERLSDSTISDMLNEYLEPDFAAKNYDAGVQTLFQAVLSRVKAIEADRADSGVKENFSRIADAAVSRRESASGFVATIGNFFKKGILLIFLVVVLLLVIILSIFRRPRWRYMGGAGWGGCFYGGRFGAAGARPHRLQWADSDLALPRSARRVWRREAFPWLRCRPCFLCRQAGRRRSVRRWRRRPQKMTGGPSALAYYRKSGGVSSSAAVVAYLRSSDCP